MPYTIIDDHDPDRTLYWPFYDSKEEAQAEMIRTQKEFVEDCGYRPSLSVWSAAEIDCLPVSGPDYIGELVYNGGWSTPDR